ncbi:MAG: T9SS type A sorting domain-containing protein [Proteobacteria bacterium]|nr:T9SS type A sorting domain-containing protein [Pseudomonadota bacterium]
MVTLKVYDLLGREIKTLVNEPQSPGNYSVQFDAGNISSGMYLYQLAAGDFAVQKKMMLLR